uniref:JmjC domain-containing protein n=1 Tax=Petromyzon marinus TaxID=7757 RepID=S4RE37_PETMA
FQCPVCVRVFACALTVKKRKNWHRHDYTEGGATGKPVQTGTPVFVKKLQGRSFPSAEEVVRRMPGSQLTADYIIENGFTSPIIVSKKDGLGMTVPPPSFTVSDVERYVGSDRMIDVIDVNRQADFKVTMKEFCEYYNSTSRQKVLNIISLEFSDTRLSDLVKAPELVHKLSWVENYWPEDAVFPRPYVQKYCLMGVRDSYTDFHIDFGGTSVWYHLLKAEFFFFFLETTAISLNARFVCYCSSFSQNRQFFSDVAVHCTRSPVARVGVMCARTGWIHAVLTPYDCIAFGGNFLHSLNVEMQIRAYDIETRLKTPEVFKFPNFESMCWYAGKSLLEMLKEMREDGDCPRTHVMQGARSLLHAFRAWTQKENVEQHEREIPDNLRPGQLIKELGKELQLGE